MLLPNIIDSISTKVLMHQMVIYVDYKSRPMRVQYHDPLGDFMYMRGTEKNKK